MVLWKETAFPLCRATERRWKRNVVSRVSSVIVVIRLPLLLAYTQFPRNEKITLCNIKKYKNHAGMDLTSPPPSQNSHAVRWHCYYYDYNSSGSKPQTWIDNMKEDQKARNVNIGAAA